MGVLLELIGGNATAPDAGPTALTVFPGGAPFTVRQYREGEVFLVTAWKRGQAATGFLRIRSPKIHDDNTGITLTNQPASPMPLVPIGFAQRFWPNDQLTLEVGGSAVGGDIETALLLLYYMHADPQGARLMRPSELEARIVNLMTIRIALTALLTGGWSGSTLLSAGSGRMKAYTDYALLGYQTSESASAAAAIGIKGPDTGNVYIGGPVLASDNELTAKWFVEISKKSGWPMIPIINQANAGGTTIEVANSEDANTLTVSLLFAELGPAAA